jgi:hypothetical protein
LEVEINSAQFTGCLVSVPSDLSSSPTGSLAVFSSSSREEMNEQLMGENKGLGSTSVTAAQFLQERRMGSLEGGWVAARDGTRGIERTTTIAEREKQGSVCPGRERQKFTG